jgi:hypothetical protein
MPEPLSVQWDAQYTFDRHAITQDLRRTIVDRNGDREHRTILKMLEPSEAHGRMLP